MSEWYESLSPMDTVFLYFAAIGGGILLFKLVLQLLGVGGAADAADAMDAADALDSDISGTADSSFKVFSIQFIASFSMMFGLVGLSMSQAGFSPFQTVIAGCIAGFAMGYTLERLMRLLLKLQHSGTLNLSNAVGKEAKVYATIPPNGIGKITVILQGRSFELSARNNSDQEFKTGSLVTITAMHGSQAEVAAVTH